jgi:hypothetical protein
MRRHVLLLALGAAVLSALCSAACDSAREEAVELNEARKDLVNEVGGAAKAQVDQAQQILDDAAKNMEKKGAAAIDQATAE